jgi:vesicle transport protein SEC22
MALLTLLARVSDGLFLVEAMETNDDVDLRNQAKKIVKTLAQTTTLKMTIEDVEHFFAYIIENGVVYLAAFEKSYSKKLAFKYLDDLQKEFDSQFGSEVKNARRPYAFISFGKKSRKK